MLQVCEHWTASLERRPSRNHLQAQCLPVLYKTAPYITVLCMHLFIKICRANHTEYVALLVCLFCCIRKITYSTICTEGSVGIEFLNLNFAPITFVHNTVRLVMYKKRKSWDILSVKFLEEHSRSLVCPAWEYLFIFHDVSRSVHFFLPFSERAHPGSSACNLMA